MGEETTLTYRRIFVLWVPLVLTWFMMAVEGPFLAAVIARLAEPEYNLAAYGVAFAFAIIIEAPIIMMLSASTAPPSSAMMVSCTTQARGSGSPTR